MRPQRDQEILNLLEELSSVKPDYPPELLAMRRAAFMELLERMEALRTKDSRPLDEQAMTEILKGLQHHNAKYPPLLLTRQRAAFLDQVAKHRQPSRAETFRSAVLNWFANGAKALRQVMTPELRRSLVVVSLVVAAFAGITFLRNEDHSAGLYGSYLAQREVSQPTHMIPVPTRIAQVAKTICTPDSPSAPSCAIHGFTQSRDRTSWVSRTANSWIKIDMGKTVSINKVEMDRKNSGDSSGDFTIAVARSDGQYETVYDSAVDQSTWTAAGRETVEVSFESVMARYVKVTVAEPGIVIDEVRAFSSIQLPPTGQVIENEDPQDQPDAVLKSTSTPVPTNTPLPSKTPAPTDTLWPTNTPLPTSTPIPSNTPAPTDTLWPTDTPAPTNTPLPPNTPAPTDTLWPTDTPVPADTAASLVATSPIEYIKPKNNE
jgi:hypothetical protein